MTTIDAVPGFSSLPTRAQTGYRELDRRARIETAGSAGPLNSLQIQSREAGNMGGQVVAAAVTVVSRSRVGKAA